jgi:hypothetical protein
MRPSAFKPRRSYAPMAEATRRKLSDAGLCELLIKGALGRRPIAFAPGP